MEKLDKLNFDLSTFKKDTLRDLSDKVLTHTQTHIWYECVKTVNLLAWLTHNYSMEAQLAYFKTKAYKYPLSVYLNITLHRKKNTSVMKTRSWHFLN